MANTAATVVGAVLVLGVVSLVVRGAFVIAEVAILIRAYLSRRAMPQARRRTAMNPSDSWIASCPGSRSTGSWGS